MILVGRLVQPGHGLPQRTPQQLRPRPAEELGGAWIHVGDQPEPVQREHALREQVRRTVRGRCRARIDDRAVDRVRRDQRVARGPQLQQPYTTVHRVHGQRMGRRSPGRGLVQRGQQYVRVVEGQRVGERLRRPGEGGGPVPSRAHSASSPVTPPPAGSQVNRPRHRGAGRRRAAAHTTAPRPRRHRHRPSPAPTARPPDSPPPQSSGHGPAAPRWRPRRQGAERSGPRRTSRLPRRGRTTNRTGTAARPRAADIGASSPWRRRAAPPCPVGASRRPGTAGPGAGAARNGTDDRATPRGRPAGALRARSNADTRRPRSRGRPGSRPPRPR